MKTQVPAKKTEGAVGRSYLPTLSRVSPEVASNSSNQADLEESVLHPDRYSLANIPISAKLHSNSQRTTNQGLTSKPPIQAKLTIGQPNDKYEQEADQVAQQVIQRISASKTLLPKEKFFSSKVVSGDGNEDKIQAKSLIHQISNKGITTKQSAIENSIQNSRGNGKPLPELIREPMEQAFGLNFSQVRVHADTQSDRLNKVLQAKAFTTGQDIFFREGQYSPSQEKGKALIAHELVHTIQQGNPNQYELAKNYLFSNKTIEAQAPNIQREIAFDDSRNAYYENDNNSDVPVDTPLCFTGEYDSNSNPIYVNKEQIERTIGKLNTPKYKPIRNLTQRRQLRQDAKSPLLSGKKEFIRKQLSNLEFYTDEGPLDLSGYAAEMKENLFEKTISSVEAGKIIPEGGSVFSARFPMPATDATLLIKKEENAALKDIVTKDFKGVKIKELKNGDFNKAFLKYSEPLAVKGVDYIYLSGGETIDEKRNPRDSSSVYKRGRERLRSSGEWENAEELDSNSNPLPVVTNKNKNANWREHKGRLNTKGRGKGQEYAMNSWNALAYSRYIYEKQMKVSLGEKMHQDWEWLHIKGAQLGGETVSDNLVAGTSTTNSRMIPVENRIKKLSRSASPKFPLSLKFEAECERGTHLGKKIKISMAAKEGLPNAGIPKIPEDNPVVYEFNPQNGQLFDRLSELLYREHRQPEKDYQDEMEE